jgi:1-acyl-sn-glycerol-3-phosphate acyltransferase
VLDFRPPLDTPLLIKTVKVVMPWLLKMKAGGTEILLAPGALERYQKVAGQRGMMCPNHSNRVDPAVMFTFSTMVHEDFNYVAARETFDWDHGINGWFLQHMGAFSVVRGAADRESFKMTRKIIAGGKKKLVLFPEGEISRQNDTLMPLESGAAQLSFWAVEELHKTLGCEIADLPPIYLTPVALKYTFKGDVRPAIDRTLSALELRLNIKNTNSNEAFYARLQKIAGALLDTLEAEYSLKSATGATMNERVQLLRRHILQSVSSQLHVKLPDSIKEIEAVRTLRNTMDDFVYIDEGPMSEYQKKVHDEKSAIVKSLYRDLDRIVNFIVIYQGYVQEQNTQERFTDVLERMESEIIGGDPSIKGGRRIYVDIGESINVCARYAQYKKEKRLVLNEVTDDVGRQISQMLVNMDSMRTPILV